MSKVKFLWLNLNLILILNQSCCFPSPFSLSLPPCLSVSLPSPPPSLLGLRSSGRIKGLSPLELMERHTCAFTHTGMRDRSCNLRWGYLEIWDGGINSIQRKERMLKNGLEGRVWKACVKMKCYSTGSNKSCVWACNYGKSWSNERSWLEVKSFKSTWGKFVFIRRKEERHLFNVKSNFMLAYTSNRKTIYSLERNVYCYQTHTCYWQA